MAWSLELSEKVFRDLRFDHLAQISGETKFSVFGRVAYLWRDSIESTTDIRTADEIDTCAGWFNPDRGSFADLMVKSKLAEIMPDGKYRIRGVEEKMLWLVEMRENASKAGKASVEKRPRDEKGRLLPKSAPENHPTTIQPSVGQNPTAIQRSPTESNPLTLSLTSALTIKTQNKELKAQASPPPKDADPKNSIFIGHYVKAFQNRYGDKSRPDLRGKVTGQIKTFLKETPLERAVNLIQVYMQMDDPWFKTKTHDFGTFLENQNKIGVALDTGQSSGAIDWQKVWGGA